MAELRDINTLDRTLVSRVAIGTAAVIGGIGTGVATWLLLRHVSSAAGLVGAAVGIGVAGGLYALVVVIWLLAQILDRRP